ncbi:Uncharacterised protein [Kingella potus]|uniref:Uncharacterized protein n=1 Tax=Kingella potus TaxID=265175 RepID=A0A377R6W9_9NEIS|nr:cell surface protein [Kingella potus]UOP00024.1 cell surface protein [Kingella potus]STR03315.1 Uncharacterised protein [Kingella potus]
MKIGTLLIAAAVFGGLYYVKHHVDTSALNGNMLQPQSVHSAQR